MPKPNSHAPDPHEVAALKEAGYTATELADTFNVCLRTVYNWLKKAGWVSEGTAPPSKRPSADILRTLYLDKRRSRAQIAASFKVDQRTVGRWLAAYNILRPAGDKNNKGKRTRIRPGSNNRLARVKKDQP